MIHIKILGHKKPQRYALLRVVMAAQYELLQDHPGFEVEITEVKDSQEIQKYTPIFIYPSLMVNDKLVCIGRYPHKEEVIGWLHQAL